MALIRPRLTDHFGIPLSQALTDFAIPFLDEDLPLYVDPFLLWSSPSQQEQALHTAIVNAFNHLGYLAKQGQNEKAIANLVTLSECDEVGLGLSRRRVGKRISRKSAEAMLELFKVIPEYEKRGFVHFEEIQFFVENVSRDRISDFTCNFLKSFLIDFTIQECQRHSIPVSPSDLMVYDYRRNDFVIERGLALPINPLTQKAILFVPKRWLRFTPWLDFDDYFATCCPRDRFPSPEGDVDRARILTFNRDNYGVVQEYVRTRERKKADCHNDPLFSQIPLTSAKRCMKAIRQIATGVQNNAAKNYEAECSKLLASLLYPQLDFAAEQSRTDSGVHIRDLIFYNNRSHPFLNDIYNTYISRQLVFEIKNVERLDSEHVNQLNRYLKDEFGRLGIFVTRYPMPRAVVKNTIDLWSAQRKCIIALSDADLETMVELYESKQRDPLDVLNRSYVEFSRACPS